MSFELFLGPAEGFRDWTEGRWDEFWARIPEGESVCWKRNYVWFAIECIRRHVCDNLSGDRLPLLFRVETDEHPGWYHAELKALLDELDRAAKGLAAVPIGSAKAEDVQMWKDAIKRRHPDRPIANLYQLLLQFFDEFYDLVREAMRKNCGIVVSY